MEIALACGWKSQGTVSQYMLGRIPLNFDAARKLADALGVDLEGISPRLAQGRYIPANSSKSTQDPIKPPTIANLLRDLAPQLEAAPDAKKLQVSALLAQYGISPQLGAEIARKIEQLLQDVDPRP